MGSPVRSDSSFQPTLPVRGATRWVVDGMTSELFQPTLPVRGATLVGLDRGCHHRISTHAPRAGSDGRKSPPGGRRCNFNPRSPCGERLSARFLSASTSCYFNPRSPCGERLDTRMVVTGYYQFQPTLPVRGATMVSVMPVMILFNFNPRSPCGERQSSWPRTNSNTPYFNPRSPCGERREVLVNGKATS